MIYQMCLIFQESFTCPAQNGFYAVDGQCISDYYICLGGESFVQVEQLVHLWMSKYFTQSLFARNVQEQAMCMIHWFPDAGHLP